jgi:preprotein translocase subunit YajC
VTAARTVLASQVQVGDRVRTANGNELTVTRIETGFFGVMLAFVEDTPERWFKQPVMETAEVEVLG